MIAVTTVPRDPRRERTGWWRVFEVSLAAVLSVGAMGYLVLVTLVSVAMVQSDVGMWFEPRWILRLAILVWLCVLVIGVALVLFEGRRGSFGGRDSLRISPPWAGVASASASPRSKA